MNDLDCLYDAYLATPEGARIALILEARLDQRCHVWMHAIDVQTMKKEILTDLLNGGFVLREEPLPNYDI